MQADKFSHIGSGHLLTICQRICPLLDKDYPPCVPGISSLLGAGSQSLLRTSKVPTPFHLSRYSVRRNRLPISDPQDYDKPHHFGKFFILNIYILHFENSKVGLFTSCCSCCTQHLN